MQVKILEIRDRATFFPVICVRPIPDNEGQRYLLRRDGYSCQLEDDIVIMIDKQCYDVSYDPYKWPANPRTKRVAHLHIQEYWEMLNDGDVIDVEFILGETQSKKISERFERA